MAWINFWINVVKVDPHVFVHAVAIGETAIAITHPSLRCFQLTESSSASHYKICFLSSSDSIMLIPVAVMAQWNWLGLPIAHWIVELHGGKITRESQPGQGTFATIFPI